MEVLKMALVHEFILVSKENHNPFDFSTIKRNDSGKIIINASKLVDVVEMSDELVSYLMDFFNWIPSSGESNVNQSYGLNYHGITCILNENRLLFGKIFGLLTDLYSLAPETFKLKGEFCWEKDNTDTGRYEFITLNRKDVVGVLKRMAAWSGEMEKDHSLYIVHMGV